MSKHGQLHHLSAFRLFCRASEIEGLCDLRYIGPSFAARIQRVDCEMVNYDNVSNVPLIFAARDTPEVCNAQSREA